MFERFAAAARDAVVGAQQAARDLGTGSIDTVCLLVALARSEDPVGALLAEHGSDPETLVRLATTDDDLDGEALTALGIDLATVRERAEQTFGSGALDRDRGRPRSGHLPFDRQAKKTLEIALREAVRLGDREIGTAHLLLALVRLDDTTGHRLLLRTGADPRALARTVEQRRRPAASA